MVNLIKVCIGCKKEYKGYHNQKYCSEKCRDHHKWLRIKSDVEKYKRKLMLQKLAEKRWLENGGKETKRKYHRTPKARNYQNKWRRDCKYWRELYARNPETQREKSRRHRKTILGKINNLANNERRRKKFPKAESFLTDKDIKYINERDRVCVYCGREFIEDKTNPMFTLRRPTFDHFNCMLPLNINNTVKACSSCNSSKMDVTVGEILKWVERKKLRPMPIVFEMINKLR